jgi:P2 family phage contractile tail tube protein
MATIFIPEALNIFVSDSGSENSKHLKITDVTLPKMSEKTMEHHPGGGIGAIQIGGLGIQALEIGFKLVGFDPQSAVQFGLGETKQVPYTILGAVRDKQTGRAIALKASAWGRMVEMDNGTWKRGDAAEQTHKIQEITLYSLTWDGSELYYYDFYNSAWRVNGTSQVDDIKGILQI